jgi:exodeoxyribonuclease V alpha subunit
MVNELRKGLRRMYITDKDTLDILIDKIALMKNPYLGIGEYSIVQKDGNSKMVKITFNMIDKLSYLLEYDMTAYERYKACIENQLDFKNNLYLTGEEIVESSFEILNQTNDKFGIIDDVKSKEKIVKIIHTMIKNGLIRHHPNKDLVQMTLEKYYVYEFELANRIKTLLKFKSTCDIKYSFDEDKLTKCQLSAIKMALSNKLSIITGGPGTGKTYLIIYLVKFLLKCEYPIYLCTPTGVSSGKINELLNKEKV